MRDRGCGVLYLSLSVRAQMVVVVEVGLDGVPKGLPRIYNRGKVCIVQIDRYINILAKHTIAIYVLRRVIS